MFGKKKESGVPVQHYEGLDFAVNYPCRLEIKDQVFTITRLKPETVVSLPLNQVKAFSAMPEADYMLKYHGEAKETTRAKGIQKYYLVVDYTSKSGEEKRLAFWGTATEYKHFLNWQSMNIGTADYSL